tara:strand:+ start:407 stop:1039 length:633 start_codon:yes stop_codon:yes gene_type:complete
MALPPYTLGLGTQSGAPDPTSRDIVFAHDASVVEDGLALLPSALRGKPNIMALLRALLQPLQTRADDNFNLYIMGAIDMAEGAMLDQWGDNVGEPRGQFYNDEEYRPFVKARALANNNDGTADELLTIFALVTSPMVCVEYIPLLPGGMQLQVFRQSWMSDYKRGRVRRLMADAAPGPRATLLVESTIGSFGPPRADSKTSATGPLPRLI